MRPQPSCLTRFSSGAFLYVEDLPNLRHTGPDMSVGLTYRGSALPPPMSEPESPRVLPRPIPLHGVGGKPGILTGIVAEAAWQFRTW